MIKRIISKIILLCGIMLICGIIYIPFYSYQTITTASKQGIHYAVSTLKKPLSSDIVINDYIQGQMNTEGLAIACIDAYESESIELTHHEYKVSREIKPYHDNEKFVIVKVIVKNNSHLVHKDDHTLIPSVNNFVLTGGKKKYHVDQHAIQNFSVYGVMPGLPIVLDINDTQEMLLAFDVDIDENFNDLELKYISGPFSSDIQLTLWR